MSETSLVNVSNLGIAVQDAKDFELVSTAGGVYLPRVQLGGATSQPVKDAVVGMGNHYIVEGEKITDLGKSVDMIVLNWTPKALRIGGEGKITTNFTPTSDEFKKIQADSGLQDSGCMYGPEYLVYIPSVQKFAAYFFSSKTSRKVSPKMQDRIGNAVTVTSQQIKNDKHSWFGVVVAPCSTPITPPAGEEIVAANEKFVAQKKQVVETVAPDARAR